MGAADMIHRLFATAGNILAPCRIVIEQARGSTMQTRENNITKKPVATDRANEKPRDPLTEAVEDAMIDQDIPVETGVRPNGTGRKERQ
jgi:hypothetical protein